MSKKTWILISCLVLSLALGLGGSLAYLTDTDTQVNTFTMGNVKIEVNEQTGTKYDGLMPGVEMPKLAKIINRGANDAYVFMTAAVPAELSKYITLVWNSDVIAKGDGVNVWCDPTSKKATLTKPSGDDDGRFDVEDGDDKAYKYEVLAWTSRVTPANMTDELLVGVKLNEWVNLVDGKYYDMSDGTLDHPITGLESFKVIVTGHAIQADGLADWEKAYDAYMGQWNNWTLDYTSGTTPDQPGIEPDPGVGGEPVDPNPPVIDPDPDEPVPVASLAELQKALDDGSGNIKVTQSFTVNTSENSIRIPENAEVVLDLTDVTLSTDNNNVIINFGNLTIKGGTIESEGGAGMIYNNDDGALTIDGTTIKAQKPFQVNRNIIINGGTFNFDPTEWVDTDIYAVTKTDDTWTVTPIN